MKRVLIDAWLIFIGIISWALLGISFVIILSAVPIGWIVGLLKIGYDRGFHLGQNPDKIL